MVQNSKFTIQLLEKIGAPLASAIESVPLQGEDNDIEAAKIMAQMLGQAVQVSIALSASMNLTESEEQADSTRLALAALAAPLLGEFYRQNERVAEDQDIKRITKSLESVLAFSENFTPAADNASRLSTIDHDAPLFDTTQVSLVVLQMLTPVIGAIAEFPFGQSETKLLQETANKLQARAADIAKETGVTDKLGELLILKSLAQIYADCHRAETAKLASSSDENRGELSLDPVWAAFDTRVAMVEAIAGQESAETVSTQQEAVQPEAAPPPITPPTEEKTAPAVPPAEEKASPAAPGNPMGFFKPGAQSEEAPPPPAATQPPPGSADSSPPPEQTGESSGSQDSSGGAPGNPMGFFKPGAKKPEDGGDTADN